jgi:processive 1,2-diacylglycerol beta-glucosyltransferase
VLLLSASTGNGHMSAARAVEEELTRRGHQAATVDVLDHTGRGFKNWYRGGYETLVKRRPGLWGRLYRASDRRLLAFYFQTGLDLVFVGRMRRFFERERPDWAVCTHSLPQPTLARWRRRFPFRLAVVMTDLYPQLMWLRGKPDRFFVPTEWTAAKLAQRLPSAAGKTTVTGIPVASAFRPATDRAAAREEAGLDPCLPTVLVTSGGIGAGPVPSALQTLASRLERAQVVVVAGRNAELEARVAAMSRTSPLRIEPRGHVATEDMARLMRACDVLVGKPGGLTTYEAMACGAPFVVYGPMVIPGQEEANAAFLVESGIAVRAGDPEELAAVIAVLLADPSRRAAMSQAALSHAKPGAAASIVDALENESQASIGVAD